MLRRPGFPSGAAVFISQQMKDPFQHIAVLGPGLLGGSLGMSVKDRFPASEVIAWGRRPEVFPEILSLGAADRATDDVADAVGEADLVVLATPVGIMPSLSERLIPHLRSGVIVTDVGSVKGMVHETTGRIYTRAGIDFIGSHPMAGSEQQGISAARRDLFEDAPLVLTNEEGVSPGRVERLKEFWTALGCRCYEMGAEAHDGSIARISHLPHSLAALCSRVALSPGRERELGRLSGGGFRDTSRVCCGKPEMWTEILLENREALVPLLEEAVRDIRLLQDLLSAEDKDALNRWLTEACLKRNKAL